MKITTERNPELDSRIMMHVRLNGGNLHARELFQYLQLGDNLPDEWTNNVPDYEDKGGNWVKWCYLDFLKYLAIYYHCYLRSDLKQKKPSPFDEFALRQLKLTEE